MPEPTIEFHGERFAVAERIGAMSLMRFAKVAETGADSLDMAGLAALYDLLEQCIAPADWTRFTAAANEHRADGDELMEVVKEVMGHLSERPTSRPSVSSDGPRTIEPRSEVDSSSAAMAQLHGRADLQLMVVQAQEARAS